MKDVQATLRRIDEEITGHNQQIARSRVEIARLQETRLVLMGIAEDDIATAQAHRDERVGVINGAHARPVLIVRKAGSDEVLTGFGDEDGTASRAAKEGLNKSGDRRGMSVSKGKGSRPRNGTGKGKGRFSTDSAIGSMRERIIDVLKGGADPMSGNELGNYFGLPASDEARKPLQNALYSMRVKGIVHRDGDRRYSLARLSQPNGARS